MTWNELSGPRGTPGGDICLRRWFRLKAETTRLLMEVGRPADKKKTLFRPARPERSVCSVQSVAKKVREIRGYSSAKIT